MKSSSTRPKPQSIFMSPTIGAAPAAGAAPTQGKGGSSSRSKSEREGSPPPLPKYPQGLTSPEMQAARPRVGSDVKIHSLLSTVSTEKPYDVNDDDDDFDVVDL